MLQAKVCRVMSLRMGGNCVYIWNKAFDLMMLYTENKINL